MITPPTEDFEIHPKATEVHGWTKEKLLALPKEQRPNLIEAWSALIEKLKNNLEINLKQNKFLCAFNGFGFDFRVLLHNLDYFH